MSRVDGFGSSSVASGNARFGGGGAARPSKQQPSASMNRSQMNSDFGGGSGGGSKRNVGGGSKNIQVIFNGKIVTPLSLIPQKVVPPAYNPAAAATAGTNNNNYNLNANTTNINSNTTSTNNAVHSNSTNTNNSNLTTNPTAALISNALLNKSTSQRQKMNAPSIGKIDENAVEYDAVSTGTGAAGNSTKMGKGGNANKKNRVLRSNQFESIMEETLLYINQIPLKSHDFSTQTSKNKNNKNYLSDIYDKTDIDNDYEEEDEDDFNKQVAVKAGSNGVSDENDYSNYSTVILSETETITILDIPSFVVNKEPVTNNSGINKNNKTSIDNESIDNSNTNTATTATDEDNFDNSNNKVDTDNVTQLISRNQAYGLIHERHLSAPDSFTSHSTQTLNDAQKNQNDMTNVIALIDIGCQASSYAIIDETRMYDDNYGDEYDADAMSARKNTGGGLTSVTSGSGGSGTSNTTTTGTNTDGSSGGGDGKLKTIIINATNNDNNYKKQQSMSTSTSTGTSTISTSTEISSVKKFVSDSVNIALMSPGCLLDMYFQKRAVSPQKSGGAHLNKSSKHRQTGMSGMMGSQAGGTSFMGSSHHAFGSESSSVINTHGHAAVTRATGASSSRVHGGGGVNVSGSHFMSGTSDNSRTGGGVSGTSRVGGMSGVSHTSGYSDSLAAGPGPGFEYHFGPNPSAPVIPTSLEGDALLRDKESKRILSSTALITQLNIMERAVLQNIYYQKQLQFRHIDETTSFDITDLIIESRNNSRRNSANNSKNHSDNEKEEDEKDGNNDDEDDDDDDDDDMKMAFLNAKQNMMKSRSVKNILEDSSVSNKSTHSISTHTAADASGHSIMASNKSGGSIAMNLIGGTGLALSRSLSNKNFNANLSRSASNKNLGRSSSNKNFTLTSNISSAKLLQTLAQQPASEKIKRLFRYANADIVTPFREVSCMIYNPSDTSLLAVGYTPSALFLHHSLTTGANSNNTTSATIGFGSMSGTTSATAAIDSTTANASGAVLPNTDENRQKGIVLFWSPRNPQYPEKILYTPYGVTSLAFSTLNPLLLAVGMNNGDIAIYDMRRGKNEWMMPMEVSTHVIGGHSETVCQLKWVVRGTNSAASATADSISTASHSTSATAALSVVPVQEDLVSVSTDGLVLQWSLKKGFTVATLMKLKRGASGDGWLSRLSAGLCFDFPSDDPSTYLVGTEEGSLHRCSVSYNEQTLETYDGHNGPLNQVKFSPFCSHVFLTCSSDWTIGLYRVSYNAPLTKLQSTGQSAAVNDVAWCPGNSTVFAAVTQEAQLQIWDLSESRTEPMIVYDTLHDDPEATLDYQSLHAAASMNGLLFTGDGSRMNSAASHTSSHSALRSALMSSGSSNSSSDRDKNNAIGTLISSSSPVIKLVDNLVQTKKDVTLKSLTSVLFSSGTHTVAVGDSLGGVTVYSITEDIAMIQDMNVMKDIINSSKKINSINTNTTGNIKNNDVENSYNITRNTIAIDNINNPSNDWKAILAEQKQRMDDVVELLTEPTNVNNKKQHQQQGMTQRG